VAQPTICPDIPQIASPPGRLGSRLSAIRRTWQRLRTESGRDAGGAEGWAPQRARIDNSLIKALARAYRWKRMLDEGRYGSVSELAAAEKLDRGYLGRILMLTLLAPDIVEAIMDGRQPAELGVHVLREGFPVEWGEQREALSPL
jgi:hypothetical protein